MDEEDFMYNEQYLRFVQEEQLRQLVSFPELPEDYEQNYQKLKKHETLEKTEEIGREAKTL